ncbi:MAG: hypothetical protein ABWY22_07120 [Flavobacterium sp.]
MKKLLVIVFFIFSTNFSFACSCIGKSKMKKEIENTNVVFTGKIVSRKVYEEKNEYNENLNFAKVEYKVLIIERLKGEIKTDTLTIFTGLGNGDCGIKFQIGKSYIIYSNYEDEHFNNGKKVQKYLSTNICTRTIEFENTEYKKIKKYARRKGYC